MDSNGLIYLGIEGGGTRTVALMADEKFASLGRREFGPGNLRLLNDRELLARFAEIREFCPAPSSIGIGLAGVRDESDRARVRAAVAEVWTGTPCAVTHDLEIALRADPEEVPAKVLVLSGTGSCCFGRTARMEAKVGGWGHLLGDKGSGYDIALSALRAAIYEFDRHGRWGKLGQTLLRTLLLNSPEDLIPWIQSASKDEVAAAAPAVFEAAQKGDRHARQVLKTAAESLAKDASICSHRIAGPNAPVTFLLAGGILVKQTAFGRDLSHLIRRAWPKATVRVLQREGVWGAVALAAETSLPRLMRPHHAQEVFVPEFVPGQSPTEQRNPRSTNFHRMPIAAAMELMLSEEQTVADSLRAEAKAIEKAVRLCARALQKEGRIYYAGAGTSGRLGVLDASECPPTFRASPEMVQGIIAGGQCALWQAVEGAEDDAQAGAAAVRSRGVGARDVLVGIAASGRTPFVWGALAAARQAGAQTILLHFNPSLWIPREHRPNVIIAPNLGPEVLTGSTRLKAGTATKLVLNMITTISMARLGKVVSNLMVDLNPSNVKLRDRAIRIVQDLTGCDRESAQSALEVRGWIIRNALKGFKPESPRTRR